MGIRNPGIRPSGARGCVRPARYTHYCTADETTVLFSCCRFALYVARLVTHDYIAVTVLTLDGVAATGRVGKTSYC